MLSELVCGRVCGVGKMLSDLVCGRGVWGGEDVVRSSLW